MNVPNDGVELSINTVNRGVPNAPSGFGAPLPPLIRGKDVRCSSYYYHRYR